MKNPKALWLTGLSGSGKSTLAAALKAKLETSGHLTMILDGDQVRQGLNNDLGFSLSDRFENIRRVAEVNRLFLDMGINTINAFISPTNAIREMAKTIIGTHRFMEIYLTTSLEICRERDPKGLYRKVSSEAIRDFSGIDSVFEPSTSASLYLDTSHIPVPECIEKVLHIFNKERP